jgi:NAD(P)-dependent dehydrogenase (short-subunit alcohol dehydrogenase family)
VDEDEAEEKGITYYQCDVSDAKQVEAAAAKIIKDVSCLIIGREKIAN